MFAFSSNGDCACRSCYGFATVGVIGFATVGVIGFMLVVVCDGVFLRVGVNEGLRLWVGGTDASARLDPRDTVTALVLDGVFDVRPLLLRWVVGLLSGEGGIISVGVYSDFRS